METNDYIAGIALIISALSALYARRSVVQAKRANELSVHAQQFEIYEEVVTFSDCFRGLFTVPSRARLEQFRQQGVNRAEIYLSDEAYRMLLEIYQHCSEQEVWLDIAEGNDGRSVERPNELEVRQDYKSVLNLLYPAIELIKKEVKVGDA